MYPQKIALPFLLFCFIAFTIGCQTTGGTQNKTAEAIKDVSISTEPDTTKQVQENELIKAVKRVMATGGDISEVDNGTTFMRVAVAKNDFELLNFLMQNKADPNVSGSDGINPLLMAVFKQNKKMTARLIDYGALVNVQNYDGLSPLHMAVFNGNKDITEMLLKNGADIELRDMQGKTPLDYATMTNNHDMARMLSPDKESFQGSLKQNNLLQSSVIPPGNCLTSACYEKKALAVKQYRNSDAKLNDASIKYYTWVEHLYQKMSETLKYDIPTEAKEKYGQADETLMQIVLDKIDVIQFNSLLKQVQQRVEEGNKIVRDFAANNINQMNIKIK